MSNRLAAEISLYLQQHAENPVDWHAWNATALDQARTANKPILLSIGYSACHWCHVMAHESFEDPASAALMNALFVNIKVDREERPDLDRIYQLAHQALTGRGGGWPLTVFLDPHTLLPFFAGTYFPKTPRHGLPSFVQILQGVRQWWDSRHDQILRQNRALQEFFADFGQNPPATDELSDRPLKQAQAASLTDFDLVNGGHRGAPKFPHASEIEQWLAFARQGDPAAAEAATVTLERMAQRGLHDHLAGGFFRYCVDERWEIPHFEKMLYDNAQLLGLYAQASVQYDVPTFRAAAEGIVDWLQAEMRADRGGFCASLDADSEGVEGKFYVWTREDFNSALDTATAEIAARHFGLDRPPNFESQAWHLQITKTPDEIASETNGDLAQIRAQLERARQQLAAHRAQRARPGRDEKRLLAWNALLATALARAGGLLRREDWLDEAAAIFELLTDAMDERGHLPAVLGSAGPGFLDDQAFALQAALQLLEARWSSSVLQTGLRLAETLLRDFADPERGGFFFTAHDHERLPQRPKPWLDEATPAGNATAAQSLLRLGFLLAEPRWLDAAEWTVRAAWSALGETPQAGMAMLAALAELRNPTPLVIVRGEPLALASWRERLRAAWRRPLMFYAISDDDAVLPASLAAKPAAPNGRATLCRGTRCLATSDSVAALIGQLHELENAD